MPRLPHNLRTHFPPSFPEYVKRCFTIDTRALALFRMLAGLLIIADVMSRARSFWFYYTDDGAVTQELAEMYTAPDAVSVFFLTNDPYIIGALFILHAVLGLVLIAGYKTRVVMALSFLLVISLDHHNPFVLSYADTLFRMLLFWSLFLPLGERWSIDALQRSRSARPTVANLATAAIMVQMVFMYSVNGQNKFPSDLWHSGEAAIIVMGIDEMTYFLGNTMRHAPFLLQIGGRTWFYLLLASPLLILLYGRARYPLIVLLMGGHASFAITVRIGAFPYVAIMGLLVFLQPIAFRDIGAVLRTARLTAIVNHVRADIARIGTFLAGRLPGRLVNIRDRDLFVRKTITVFVAIFMVGLFILPTGAMLAEGPALEENPLPDDNPVEEVASNWGVDQPVWSIFAGPGPRNVDRYYVFPARTADGQVFDLYNERPMTYERPGQHLQRQHDVYRNRFYMNTMRRGGSASQPNTLYVDYLCEKWEEERGIELTHINMWTVTERITLETIGDPANRSREEELIGRYTCGDEVTEPISPPP